MTMNTEKLKNIVSKLREINIKDLQNIDARQVAQLLQQRVDVLLNIVLILATTIVLVLVSRGYGKKAQLLTWEAQQIQERLDAIKDSERLQGEYGTFMRSFPKVILTGQLINKLSEFAAYRHVQILSFSPIKEKSDEYIKVATVQINAAADTYENMILFMKDIEESPYALRVEQWSAKMKEQKSKEGEVEIRKEIVEAKMDIASLKLKDE